MEPVPLLTAHLAIMENATEKKQLRSFGLTVGGIFAVIGLWPAVVHWSAPRSWAMVLALLLIGPALVYSRILYWPHKGWMLVCHVLGSVNTRIILGFIFFAVVTPIGIVRRLLGKDPMGRNTQPALDSYRVPRTPRPASHLTKQY
jgi:hypothetical protein